MPAVVRSSPSPISAFLAALERALVPLDRVRSAGLRLVGRPIAVLFSDPARRVAWFGSAGLVLAFATVLLFPGLTLLLGPLLLGVPHLLADLRYLVVEPGHHRRRAVVLAVVLPSLAAFVVPSLEVAGATTVGAAAIARGAVPRRVAVASLGLTIVGLGLVCDERAEIVFAHLHNALAFVWLFVASRRPTRPLVVPTLLAFLGTTLLASGALRAWLPDDAARWSVAGIPWFRWREGYAPIADPRRAEDLVLAFAFAQSAHYAVWLRFAPEMLRARAAPRSFVRSLGALRGAFGDAPVALAVVLSLGFVVAGCVHAGIARDGYLRLALFHAPLEVALLGLAFSEGGGRCRSA